MTWNAVLRRACRSIRVRLLAMMALAVVPLAFISINLALQNYQAASSTGMRRVSHVMLGFVAARTADITDATYAITRLAAMPTLADPATCAGRLGLALAVASPRIDAVSVETRGGATICRTGNGETPVDPALVGAARPGGGVVLGPISRDDAQRRYEIRAVVAGADPSPLVVSASIRIDVTDQHARDGDARIWLLDGMDHLWPLCWSCTDRGPDAHGIARLLLGTPSVSAPGSGGTRWIYVLGNLPGGGRLVLGDRASPAEARAATLLFHRIVSISLLLLVGLAVVMAGAHVTIAEPVRVLTRRVSAWRTGAAFDATRIRFVPSELSALIDAFRQATTSLAAREEELARATTAQELAIKEIHHRVKNNLQIIASLLNLQANRIRQPEARAEFQSARDRVKALATLHRHLYGEAGVHRIAMRGFLLELCGQLFQAMGEREGQRIALTIEAPELEMSSDQAVPLALVITEAVSNSLKYAFPNGREGHIALALSRTDANMIVLDIQDDGIGIPAGRAETETGVRDGLGLTLIRGFARQLGATLEVTEDGGTHYHLAMPLHLERTEHEPEALG